MKRKLLNQNKTSQFLELTKQDVLSSKEMLKIKGGDGDPPDEKTSIPPPPPGKG